MEPWCSANPADDGQTQPGAAPARREVRKEQLLAVLSGDAMTGVANVQLHGVARGAEGGRHRQETLGARGHGFQSVVEQVHHRAAEQFGVNRHQRQ